MIHCPMHPTIRKFEPHDAPSVHQVANQSPQAAAWPLTTYEKLAHSSDHHAWVAECNTSVCGFLVGRITASDEAEILNLAVAPAHRRSGHATALLQTCLAEFTRLHIARVFLEVREFNSAAISFYEEHNFVRAGVRPAYYQNPTEAAVLLIRKLTA
jgi:[ribosomal protein S18]-alanine N-acetyltransferase